MRVLQVRNVHQALIDGIRLLKEHGIERSSRNGPVLVAPWPVTTVYEKPFERVIFWPQRDANPFFHLYESLWMLQGRNDIAPLVRYAKNMANYSDDGVTQHGAYGKRWRRHFLQAPGWIDQLARIAVQLQEKPEDRRCVLQMWDTTVDDINGPGKDYPCNTIATFQRDSEGKLNLVVFCRSNDIIWGAYGANAVHFSMLLEYMALWIGCPVGTYTQISVNYHAYLNTLQTLKDLPLSTEGFYANGTANNDPYGKFLVRSTQLFHGMAEDFDQSVKQILLQEENHFSRGFNNWFHEPFLNIVHTMLRAHIAYRELPKPQNYQDALKILGKGEQTSDWIVAGTEWMERRKKAWEVKQ